MSYGEDGHGIDDGNGREDGRSRSIGLSTIGLGQLSVMPSRTIPEAGRWFRSPVPVVDLPPVPRSKVEPIRPVEPLPVVAYAGSKYTTRAFRNYRHVIAHHAAMRFGRTA